MSELITLILQSLQLVGKFFDLWREQDDKKLTAKKEALNEVLQGVADNDANRITKGFDLYNSIK